MQLLNVSGVDSDISYANTVSHVHSNSIRELAVQGGQTGLVASGGKSTYTCELPSCHRLFSSPALARKFSTGFEGNLCISSFVDAQNVSVTNKGSLQGKVIGSVKWPSFNSSQTAAHRTQH